MHLLASSATLLSAPGLLRVPAGNWLGGARNKNMEIRMRMRRKHENGVFDTCTHLLSGEMAALLELHRAAMATRLEIHRTLRLPRQRERRWRWPLSLSLFRQRLPLRCWLRCPPPRARRRSSMRREWGRTRCRHHRTLRRSELHPRSSSSTLRACDVALSRGVDDATAAPPSHWGCD